ncbi:hypothetical protein VE01_01208 [Pseudogymnoascus verrucosus]|uniref:Major facilitator superfamily (MFS) profile domain-containing protein n=1 Tax=Pseudogymnoascus verrucosus TaxID=342668 RepID=A0A1B8GXN6_9PEZI|nr:uncharacterized protein VE01_01208 [Pseudogymnoascus verrucosus]OBU00594.1 hypothetical protein VE01_01208 [Pseudogymnoascus verrucosus]
MAVESPHSSSPNDINLSDRNTTILIVTIVTVSVATVLIAGRLISRAVIVKHITFDDYLIVIGWILSLGASVVVVFATGKGLGKPDARIKDEWVLPLKKCIYAFSVLYNPALVATKSSLLVFYLRLSRVTNKLFRIISYAALVLVNAGGLVLTLLYIFQCRPVSKTFNVHNDLAKCIPIITLYLTSTPITIVTDVIILVLPIPMLTGIHMPRRQKNILVFTFALGIFVMIVDVIRVYFLQQAMIDVSSLTASPTSTIGLGDEKDYAFIVSYSLMWTAVEVNIGIVCACIPTLKPIVKRILPILLEPTRHHSSHETPTASVAKVDNTDGSNPSPESTLQGKIPPANIVATAPIAAKARRQVEADDIEFITIPTTATNMRARQESSASSSGSVYFGFVNIRRPKCLADLSSEDSWRYCTAVTILFFLWGFSYGLLNHLNSQIVAISHSAVSQGIGLLSAYWGGYIFGPLSLGWYALTRGGFKVTFIAGLCVYGVGTLMFWPSAVLVSFPGFVISTFVVGFGLSVLETAANPFLALAGPPLYGEMRLLLAQGVQAIGSVVSELLSKVLFASVKEHSTLIGVQWTYLAISYLAVILGLFFYYMPLPEATDQELQRATRSRSLPMNRVIIEPRTLTHIGAFRVVSITLAIGVFAQFLYVAAQETVNLWFSDLFADHDLGFSPSLTLPNISLVGHSVFAVSRFLCGALCLVIRPRKLLCASLLGGMAISITIAALPSHTATTHPNTVLGLTVGLYFFEGPVFPLIFAIALRGLGRATKRGAVMLAAGTGGGAMGPWVLFASQSKMGVRRSFWIVAVALGMACLFPVYLKVVRRAREVVDWNGVEGKERKW